MVTPLETIVYTLIITVIGSNILSLTASNFTESTVLKVNNWSFSRLEYYESQNGSRFSITGIKKLIFNFFSKLLTLVDNRINSPKLRNGTKLSLIIITLLLLFALLAAMVAGIVYLIIGILVLYMFKKILELWYRYEMGLPLFPDKNKEYYVAKHSYWDQAKTIIRNEKGDKVGEVEVNWKDKFTGNYDKKTIKDSEGKVVGTVSTGFWDKFSGNYDNKTIKDEDENNVGSIKNSFWNENKKIIRDKDGNEIGDIKLSEDRDIQTIAIKKERDE